MKKILITGATTGIGLAIAKKFLMQEDYLVLSISRNPEKRHFEHEKMRYYFADISNADEILQLKKQIETEYGNLDVLINNAGTIIPGGIESLEFDDWNKSLNNNLSSYFNVTKAFADLLKKSSNSCIVNISSISAKLGGSSVAYSVAKAGVDMFTQVAAREFGKYKIRVNAVSPGIVNSGFQVANGVTRAEDYETFLENQSSTYPLGIGDVSEIAKAVYFLVTEEASWITGTNITVDGGRSVMV